MNISTTEPEGTLWLLRGVSGSGKTTLAKMLESELHDSVAFSADDFWYLRGDGNYAFDPSRLHEAHKWCQERTRNAMNRTTRHIIVHNTLTSEKELKPYLEMAKEFGYEVKSLVVENRHGNSNTHNVPDKVLEKQESRLRNNIVLRRK